MSLGGGSGGAVFELCAGGCFVWAAAGAWAGAPKGADLLCAGGAGHKTQTHQNTRNNTNATNANNSVLRAAIMARMARWLKEAAASDAAIYGRMLAAAQELRDALAAL